MSDNKSSPIAQPTPNPATQKAPPTECLTSGTIIASMASSVAAGALIGGTFLGAAGAIVGSVLGAAVGYAALNKKRP